MTNQDKPLGEVFRARRLAAGLTQREAAAKAGVSIRTLHDAERGHLHEHRRSTLRRLARAVGLADDAFERPASGTTLAVLGPMIIHRDGKRTEIGTGKQRQLLALLALHPNQLVGHAEIVDALWRGGPPASHPKLISGHVAAVRELLGHSGPAVTTVPGGYRLAATQEQLDLVRFEELATRADDIRHTDPPAALEQYQQALDCWRGPVLSDEDPVLRQHPAATGVSRRRVAVLLAYADLAIELGAYPRAEAELHRVVDDEPLHEGLHARLMLALAGTGQQSAALRLYAEVRGRLSDELGVAPSAELTSAHQRVLRQEIGDANRGRWTPAQLPADVIGFAGRAGYLSQLDNLLADSPTTIAIVGTAGVGKTALAVHWSHSVRQRFPDGQLYADLRGFSTDSPQRPGPVLARFLRALGVPAERVPADPTEASALYRTVLSGQRVLIVLDNAANSDHVRPLLPGSSGCLVLVTSRDRFTGLTTNPGAHRIELDVLTRDESTALLTNLLGTRRAAAPAEVAELARVCADLPLALRVAAADLVGTPHRGIGARAAELATDRLGMLDGGGDSTSAVRAAFDHSYAALPDTTRQVFRVLGAVPGADFTDELVAAMAEIPVRTARRELDRLAAAHLVTERAPRRYTFHDLLREYAADQAGRADPATNAATRLRQHRWYLDRTDAAVTRLYPGVTRLPRVGPTPAVTFTMDGQAQRWLDDERANLLACIRDAADVGPHQVAWLLADLLRTDFWAGMRAADWLHAVEDGMRAALAQQDLRAQAAMHLSLGNLHLRIHRFTDALEHSARAVELGEQARWPAGLAAAHHNLGNLRRRSGELHAAIDHHEQALRLNTAMGFVGALAVNLAGIGQAYAELGQLTRAVDYYRKSIGAHRVAGSRHSSVTAISMLARVCHQLGRLEEAVEHLTEAIAITQSTGNRASESEARAALARVHLDAGRTGPAVEQADTALALAHDCADPTIEAGALGVVADTRVRIGDPHRAVTCYQRALEAAKDHNARLELETANGLAEAWRQLGQLTEAARLSQCALDAAGELGYRLIEARALEILAAIDLDRDRTDSARTHIDRALERYRDAGHVPGQARCHKLRRRIH